MFDAMTEPSARGKGGAFTTGFFVGSFSLRLPKKPVLNYENVFFLYDGRFRKPPWERNFIKMFNESGRISDSVIMAHSTDRWFS